MDISIGSQCFAYWYRTEEDCLLLDKALLNSLKSNPLVDGMELVATYAELEAWFSPRNKFNHILPGDFSLLSPQTQLAIKKLRSNSVHLPSMNGLTEKEVLTLKDIVSAIHARLYIKEFTIHPDRSSFDQWDKLLHGLDGNISISIENMDKRKENYRTLEECAELLRRYPSLKFTFDMCHWLENEKPLLDYSLIKFLNEFAPRVSKIHFSVPWKTPLYDSFPEVETSHYLMTEQIEIDGVRDILAAVPKAIVVIEGVVPVNCLASFRKETLVLKELMEGARGVDVTSWSS